MRFKFGLLPIHDSECEGVKLIIGFPRVPVMGGPHIVSHERCPHKCLNLCNKLIDVSHNFLKGSGSRLKWKHSYMIIEIGLYFFLVEDYNNRLMWVLVRVKIKYLIIDWCWLHWESKLYIKASTIAYNKMVDTDFDICCQLQLPPNHLISLPNSEITPYGIMLHYLSTIILSCSCLTLLIY